MLVILFFNDLASPMIFGRNRKEGRMDKAVEDAIKLIADVAENTAAMAGVGAMETAGSIISCMVADPKFMRRFFECPSEAILSDRFDPRCNGALSYHAVNGEIVAPKNHAESRRRPTAT